MFPPHGRSPRRASRSAPPFVVQVLEPRALFSAGSIIDMMIVYTPQALSEAGSLSALNYRINRSIADTNMALANSQVNATIRLVDVSEVNYTESGTILTDLDNIQSGAGAFSGVPALRAQYGADLVSLWVGNGSSDEAGRAFQPDHLSTPDPSYGYSIVQEQYADNNYVFAHETGHNLGAGHDSSDTTPRAIPYAYGKTFTIGNYTVGDIMSDLIVNGSLVERIPYYSNPTADYQGVPTGNPDNASSPANNAEVMNQFAPIVANYEPTVVTDTAAPQAAVEAVIINPGAQTLTLKIAYADDSAVSVSNLGTGDILITGGGGFSQLASFQGVDYSTDGAQRVATYQVSIAGHSQDPSTYSFTLEPNRLADVYGNVSAGGALGNPAGSAFPNRAGPRLVSAYDAGTLDGTTEQFSSVVNADSPTAFYRFNLAAQGQFTANLSGLTDSVNELLVQDRNQNGQVEPGDVLAQPVGSGTNPETISMQLNSGTYYLWVAPPVANTVSNYTLTMSDVPTPVPPPPVPPVPPTPPPPPPPIPPPPPPSATIAGTIFNLASGSGTGASLAGFTVYADLKNDGSLDVGDPSATTDAAGNYQLTGLSAGTYLIRIVPDPGWRETFSSGDGSQSATLTASQSLTGVNFNVTRLGMLLGSVFNDANADGVLNAHEASLSGWQVYIDRGNTGSINPSDPVTTTDAWGNFSFSGLDPGTYVVRIVPQSGWTATTPNAGSYSVTLVGGGVVGGLLIGEQSQ